MKGETKNNVNATDLTMAAPDLWVTGFQGEIQNLTQILRMLLQNKARAKDLTKESKLVSL